MLAPLSIAGWMLFVSAAPAQIAPRILHQGLGCIVAGQHAVVDALVEPQDDLVTVKVYFRAEMYPAFFYVEASPNGERHQAILPRPTRDVSAVVYYLEAVDSAFNSFRTEEFRPRVVEDAADCSEDEEQPAYVEGPASITVGATAAASTFPPGFLTEGIVGTITAAGRAAGGSSGPLIGIGAAAGAAAGVGVLVGGGDAGTTTVPAAIGPTTTVAVTTSAALTTSAPPSGASLVACFDTSPRPPTIPVGETVRFDASCSQPRDQIVTYAWDFHDGRDGREGRVVTRQYQSAGVFPAELTTTDIRGVQARTEKEVRVTEVAGPPGPGPGGGKAVKISKGGPPSANVGVAFAYNITLTNTGSSPATGITMTDTLPASLVIVQVLFTANADNCGQAANTVTCTAATLARGASFTVTITVRPTSAGSITNVANVVTVSPSESSSDGHSTAVSLKAQRAPQVEFLSEIQSASPGQIHASMEINGLGTATAPGVLTRLRMTPQAGPNVLAGFASGTSLEGALWKLDFSATEGFVPGSIAVEAGEVVSASSHAVVFRLGGEETRIRLRFRMDP